MKNSIYYICLLSLFFSCSTKVDIKDTYLQTPELEVLTNEYDFGVKSNNDTILHTYVIKNLSNIPYRINKVNESCGCTTTKYTKEEVLKNETAEIEVLYIPSNDGSKKVSKSVVISDNSKKSFHVFYLKGEIVI